MNQLVEFIITIAILGSFIFLCGSVIYYLYASFDKRDMFTDAYNLLRSGERQQTLNEREIQLIYNHTFKKYNGDSYADFLEKILIRIRENDRDGKLTSNFNALLEPIIDKEKAEKPYLKVDEKERCIIQAIEDAANNNEKNSLRKNLVDLSEMIVDKQKALKNSQRINRLSIPLSIIGILTTILIWAYGSSVSEEDINKISEKTSELVLKGAPSTPIVTEDSTMTEQNKKISIEKQDLQDN